MGFDIAKKGLKVRRKWRNGGSVSVRTENINMVVGKREPRKLARP